MDKTLKYEPLYLNYGNEVWLEDLQSSQRSIVPIRTDFVACTIPECFAHVPLFDWLAKAKFVAMLIEDEKSSASPTRRATPQQSSFATSGERRLGTKPQALNLSSKPS